MNDLNTYRPDDPDNLPSAEARAVKTRRPLYEWLAWGLWLITLGILLEFALTSFVEHETQAAVLASALMVGLLLAGLIVEAIQRIERASAYRYRYPVEHIAEPDSTTEDSQS